MYTTLGKYIRLRALYFAHKFLGQVQVSALKLAVKHPDLATQVKDGLIFIHIPKTGGSSISSVLYGDFRKSHSHYSITDFEQSNSINLSEMTTVCVVRNPWDRFRSAYDYFRKPPSWASERTLAFSTQWVAGKSFPEFVEFVVKNPWLMEQPHFKPQTFFTNFQDRMRIDHVLRYESLERDARNFFQEFGHHYETLPQLNASERLSDSYREYYDLHTRDLVGQLYESDLETFNYSFD